jgi:hypothetical protein
MVPESILGDVDLAAVHEVECGQEILVGNATQIDQRVWVRILSQDMSEEGTAGCKNHLKENHKLRKWH